MGISNVEKYMMWVQGTVKDKKQAIKEEDDEIQSINQRIIESKRKHEYFVGKMQAYRNRLRQKKDVFISNSTIKENSLKLQGHQKKDSKASLSDEYTELKLTEDQLMELEQYKQVVK